METCLKINTAPSVEPVTLYEAKIQLRIDESPDAAHRDDDYVTSLIEACRKWCEAFQNRAYITQTWDLYLDEFPGKDYIEIPLPPLQSVTYLKYKDTDGTLQTWGTSNYVVDINREPGRIALAYGISWPLIYDEMQAVQIQFIAGYGDAATSVPEAVKTAIKLKITELYENRGDADMRADVREIYEDAIKTLLWPDRITPI